MKLPHNLGSVWIIASSPQKTDDKLLPDVHVLQMSHTSPRDIAYNTEHVYISQNGSILVLPRQVHFPPEQLLYIC